jgi:MoaA/NifB/PqqE/SkfB family radical SAM enzyme
MVTIGTIDCDLYGDNFVELYFALKKFYKKTYLPNERIVIQSTCDYYKNKSHGLLLESIQNIVNHIDISNCFIRFITTNIDIEHEYNHILKNYSTDPHPFEIELIKGNFSRLPAKSLQPFTKSNSIDQYSPGMAQLTKLQRDKLFSSKNFCMLPWVALMVGTQSEVAPCCWYKGSTGDCSTDSLETIWNNKKQQKVRELMLEDKTVTGCRDCVHIEQLGKQSLRQSMNSIFARHIDKATDTMPSFNLKYFDSRFNNLCNLSCRMCYHGSSSSWHKPAVEIGLIDKSTPVYIKAGRTKTDLYDQFVTQLDNVERIYFAGGEPLMIQDNYDILEELDKRQKHHVELVYNTNMTQHKLRGRDIFDLWKNFKNITIYGSLDAENNKAQYVRAGTVWQDVVAFRKQMIQKRPDISFKVSSTISIINALHVPDFHRNWVEQKLIKPYEFNINTLQFPKWLSVDTAPQYLRDKIIDKYNTHLDWLRPLDKEGNATLGFESVLMQLNKKVAFDPSLFWQNIKPLDKFYKTNLLDTFPELVDLPR